MAVEIYSTDTDSGQVSVIRKNGSEHQVVTRIPVGNAPRGSVKFTSDGRGFVCNTSTNTVSELDALTHREIARIQVGAGPRGMALVAGEKYLVVSNSGANTISVVDLESRQEITQVAVGRDPRHMAVDPSGDYVYVCVWGSGYIAVLDVSGLGRESQQSVREVARIRIEENAFPYSLNVDRQGLYALVACNAVEYVPVIDLTTREIVARVPVESDGARAIAFTPDNRYALVTLERTSNVAVISMETFSVTRYIPVGPAPRGIAIDDNDETAYISAFSRNTVMRADVPHQPHSLTVLRLADADLAVDGPVAFEEIRVGHGPCSVSVFDSEKVSIHATALDTAVRDLVNEATPA
ncbi:MAG: cytochrome D1 domain-containing protein [Kineosporiaceae bacterium]